MIFATLPTGPLEVNCYIVGSETTSRAVVFDPGGDADRILSLLAEKGLELGWVINTHGHFDHIGANGDLLAHKKVELMIHADDVDLLARANDQARMFGMSSPSSPAPTRLLEEGEDLVLDDMQFQIFHVPGHSPGSLCFLIDDILIGGDTIFAGSIGRTDLPGGNHQQLIDHITSKLLVLPDNVHVCPGHGPMTTIGWEKRNNPFLS